ncbi:MFS general substrate transporter [Teratosphaeria nubilosa]|uniref:MFS general substrate transporter n=1 Tax=Teratosphaeria nubilosa TaxID=161662 RepID=A0A6G1L7A7_9PEZI|nr:MFS general substrate transporter [Teratosphaeria nubilosa]
MEDEKWPPGTVKLQQLLHNETKDAKVILQPRPTDNPNDPLNWPQWQKILNYFLASFYAMMVFCFVNATSPTWGPLADELHFSDATLTNTYAIGCATLAMGAPMLIPFALKYGSRPVYILSSLGQFLVSIWAARTMNAANWWGVNSVQCWLGALAEVLIQMTIADVFFVHQRGLMNAIYIWTANVGSNLGVVASGFITDDMGWRWVWWFCAIFFGIQLIMFVFGFEETKFNHTESLAARQGSIVTVPGGPIGERSKINHESEKTPSEKQSTVDMDAGSVEDAVRNLSIIHINPDIPRKTYWQKLSLTTTSPGKWSDFLCHAWQPFLILGSIPGVTFCCLTYAILLALSTVQSTVLSDYMIDPPYNFDSAQIGLMSLGPFIGTTLGSLVVGPVSDWWVIRLSKRNDGIYEPEMRFWVFLPFIPFQIAGGWWFGYALANGWSWPHVAVAYGVCNFGSAPLQSLALTYMLDAYNDIIGDALTALTFARNTMSTIFVFAIPAWIPAVGMANVFNTILPIELVILSFAAVFIWKGKLMRAKTAGIYRHYAERQFEARPIK